MVLLKILKILFLILSVKVLTQAKVKDIQNPKYFGLTKATESLISSFFVTKEYASITITMAMGNTSSLDGCDLGNEILKGIDGKLRTIVRGHQRKLRAFDKRRSPIILIIDSIEAFEAIKIGIRRIYPKYYLIILVNGLFDDTQKIIKEFWNYSFVDVNFLVANETHALIYTYFPFRKGKCGTDKSLDIINTFNLEKGTWSSTDFYPDKVANLNNCTLYIGVTETVPMVIVSNATDGSKTFDGIEVLFIKNLGDEFNFNSEFILYDSIGSVKQNKSATVLGAILNRQSDIAIGTLSLQVDRANFLSVTSMFTSIPIICVIPPPSHVTPFKKLFLPFDPTTWILLFVIFATSYAVIVLTKYRSLTLYKLIVGNRVNFPFTNMIIAFFGQSQKTLPTGNFSRFLLGKFLIFCLLIRGMYQGKLYDIMKKEIFEKMPETFDDLLAKDFVFYTYESLSSRVQGFKFARNVQVIKNSEIEFYRQKTLDSEFRGVVFSYKPQVMYLNLLNRKYFTYLMLNERFVTNQMVFYLQENHFMTEKFHTKIDWFREFGITDYVISIFIDKFYFRKLQVETKRKPITLNELYAVFMIWIGGLVLAVIACVIEISSSFHKALISKGKRKFKAKIMRM